MERELHPSIRLTPNRFDRRWQREREQVRTGDGQEEDRETGSCGIGPALEAPVSFLGHNLRRAQTLGISLFKLPYKGLSKARQSRKVNPWTKLTQSHLGKDLLYICCTYARTYTLPLKYCAFHVRGDAPNCSGSHWMMTMATEGVGKTLLRCL